MEGGQMKPNLYYFSLAFVIFLTIFLGGCAVVEKGAQVLEQGGKISTQDKELITKTSKAARTTFRDLSEEEEYYIGRSVAALILARYKVWDNPSATNYINLLTQAVALYSDRPEIYEGYHVLLLDSEEVNALAAPGGFIFITRGLLKTCPDEDALAGVLAHEIGHVSARHGLQAIKKSRLVEAFKLLAVEAAERLAAEKVGQLTELFEGALDDIVAQLIERGYDRQAEMEADSLALKTVNRAGYSPAGLILFLEKLSEKEARERALKGWFSTHPKPQDRLEKLRAQASSSAGQAGPSRVRTARFQKIASTWK